MRAEPFGWPMGASRATFGDRISPDTSMSWHEELSNFLVPAASISIWDLRAAHGHVAVADHGHINVRAQAASVPERI
jgi:hypothetical protein